MEVDDYSYISIPIKDWYPTYRDWLLSPVLYIDEDGVKELPLGESDKILKAGELWNRYNLL